MSLQSVNNILGILQQQAQWQQHPFQSLLQLWPDVVGKVAASHTRPLSIQRQVLQVATSSAAWAQNMTFTRTTLLLKLNQQLSEPLVDIRFSTKNWQALPDYLQQKTLIPQEHPSYLGDVRISSHQVKSSIESPNTAFTNWAKTMQMRSHGLPLCPQCQSPTPPGEIQRWEVCCVCAAKDF
ncbi:DciA family protein [Nodularia harveyana UHCC-0300]|uniref:DciA family protein n=1 Tax=Nodularia harveyana UHCC-0300 TaxID=2974287 RepID=A0ABU5UES1_9CYAN|nr:DciA family protein [Nodularia harveyana]MEA5580951.1 DciA family protein [Nodularia harveyana UHCC-0300]